jgi:hypothetical protein
MEIRRDVELEVDAAAAWQLVADPDRWADWLGDAVDIAVEDGAVGTVEDDGIVRFVHIDRVHVGRRVEFTWWEAGGDVARVVLEVEATPTGSRIRITERVELRHDLRLDLQTSFRDRQQRWEARVCALWACTVVAALVP